MKSPRIKISFDEFDLMEWRFGWKHEYWGGYARITPRHESVLVKIPVEKREIKTSAQIIGVKQVSVKELEELFFDSFVETVEYCDYKRRDVRSAATKNIQKFFDGNRGEPQIELSRTVILEGKLAGAALITKRKYGFKLEILFVRPQFQNIGIGTALVSTVLNGLCELGEKVFWSEHHACNQQSAAWHKRFGFVEEPDLRIARMRYYFYKHDAWRLEKLQEYDKLKEVQPLLEKAETEYKRLEEIEEKEGFDVANLMWKYD